MTKRQNWIYDTGFQWPELYLQYIDNWLVIVTYESRFRKPTTRCVLRGKHVSELGEIPTDSLADFLVVVVSCCEEESLVGGFWGFQGSDVPKSKVLFHVSLRGYIQ